MSLPLLKWTWWRELKHTFGIISQLICIAIICGKTIFGDGVAGETFNPGVVILNCGIVNGCCYVFFSSELVILAEII